MADLELSHPDASLRLLDIPDDPNEQKRAVRSNSIKKKASHWVDNVKSLKGDQLQNNLKRDEKRL